MTTKPDQNQATLKQVTLDNDILLEMYKSEDYSLLKSMIHYDLIMGLINILSMKKQLNQKLSKSEESQFHLDRGYSEIIIILYNDVMAIEETLALAKIHGDKIELRQIQINN